MAMPRESYNIILNKTHRINQYTYRYPMQQLEIKSHGTLNLNSASLYYSWFNVSSEYNNNKITLTLDNIGGPRTLNITFPDGFYTVEQLNSYVQKIFVENGWYLQDSNGNNVYFWELVTNESYYRCEIKATRWPLTTSGYTVPSGFVGVASQNRVIQTTILGNFGKLIGFSNATYPQNDEAVSYNQLGDLVPNISPISTILVLCNLAFNRQSSNSSTLASIGLQNTRFGQMIVYNSAIPMNITVRKGIYDFIEIELRDNNYNPLPLIDPDILISLHLQLY